MSWTPIVTDKEERAKIEQVIYKISKGLGKEITNSFNQATDPSLMYGRFGKTLLYAYLFQYSHKKTIFTKFNRSVDESFALIAESENEYSFGKGFSGYAWCIQHLINQSFMDGDVDELLADIMENLYQFSDYNLEKGDYDYLLGGLGPSIFLLERARAGYVDNYLKKVVASLQRLAVKTSSGLYAWEQVLNDGPSRINFGIAHGVPGLLVILSKCYQYGIEKDLCLELINGGLAFIDRSKLNNCRSVFSYSMQDGAFQGDTPLRWCYGDLGVAAALYKIGQVMERKELCGDALAIALQCSVRLRKELPKIADAHFCHGSAGIGHLFSRLFNVSGEPQFRDDALYCLEDTLRRAIVKEDYITFIADKGDFGHLHIDGLMEGSIGIALSLLAMIDTHEPCWDACFLLS